MCRLYAFRSNEPTKVECSLVYAQNALLGQSAADLRGQAHPDGWGIAYYVDGIPAVERRAVPAFEDLHFSLTAERVFAHTVVAHVRQATVGERSIDNAQPFAHGAWTFAHNGTVRGFDRLEPQLTQETDPALRPFRSGSTDSEAVFFWLLTRFAQAGIDLAAPGPDPVPMGKVLAAGVRRLDMRSERADASKPARLNFVLTNGDMLLVSRWRNSIYTVERRGLHDCEICGIPHSEHDGTEPYRALVVASEPITHEEWREVPEAHVLAVAGDLGSTLLPI